MTGLESSVVNNEGYGIEPFRGMVCSLKDNGDSVLSLACVPSHCDADNCCGSNVMQIPT